MMGRSYHRRYLPGADLAGSIEHYWIVRWEVHEPQTAETLPHPSVHIVFGPGSSRVVGVMTRRFSRRIEGKGQVFGIKLKPGGFYPYFGRPVSEITDRELDFGQVFHLPEPAILAGEDDAAQCEAAEAFLRTVLPPPDPNQPFIDRAIATILADRDVLRVEDLGERLGASVRGLQRLFRRHVGVSPKWTIRRYRLHEAAERLAAGAVANQAALAAELGYCDQAHFIKDFTALVGRPPAAYAKSCKDSQR